MERPVPDRDLTEEEKVLVNSLTDEQIKEIDEMLLSHVHPKYSRKVAFLVGATMSELPSPVKGIPDVIYSQRVAHLVEQGILFAEGSLKCMRFSEVRFP
ncbi:hypothetical protein R50072_36980 [Simiduia litorea]|uniref:DUF3658 domain-containing protein n=1 Tax=Simiduia litorea TaxID=1435348 RepID=UPI0036F42C40